MKGSPLAVPESVGQKTLLIRGQRVMLDADLAELYGVVTKALNQAVRRNAERFPADFMFQLTSPEKQKVVTNCDHLAKLKFSKTLPHAFTEHGALMLGNVLKSPRATQISLLVVRPSSNCAKYWAPIRNWLPDWKPWSRKSPATTKPSPTSSTQSASS